MALTGTITTDRAPTLTWTVASGAGSVGAAFTDPISGVITTIVVTWASTDAASCAAWVAVVNANTAINTFVTATQIGSTGVATLTYTGAVGFPALVTASGTGVTITGGTTLGIYSDGQTAYVTMAWVSSGLAALTVTAVDLVTTGQTIESDAATTMIGAAIPASATTTFTFPAVVRSGQVAQVTCGLNWSLVCGNTIGTCTTYNIAIAPPAFNGAPFPNEVD